MLPTAQPYQYNIIFSDSSVQAKLQIILRNIQDKWIGDLTASGKLGRLRDTTGDLAKQQQRLAQIVNETYSEFTLRTEYSAAVESMRALNIWEAGNYQVTLIVHTAKPTRIQEIVALCTQRGRRGEFLTKPAKSFRNFALK